MILHRSILPKTSYAHLAHNPNTKENIPQPKQHKKNSQTLEKLQETEAQPDFFFKNPLAAPIVSSKILGEATEDARNNIREEIIDDDFTLIIEGNRNSENDEMFTRSIIVVAQSSQSSSTIMESILSEGVNFLSIEPLGGLMHLVTFESYDDKLAMVESKWLERWFIDLRDVNMSTAQ